jgi:hypothetical protein
MYFKKIYLKNRMLYIIILLEEAPFKIMPIMQQLFNRHLKSITLKILIFGPDSKGISTDVRVNALKKKRVEIRDHLINEGHKAVFPEDIVDPNAAPPMNNPAIVENLLMKEYDIIINLVETPGSLVEAGKISEHPYLAAKALLFIGDDYCAGFPYATCQQAEQIGAKLSTFSYPNDLTQCHLLTKIADMINKIQLVKFYS